MFTEIALPSQLSENNIPGISALKSSHYHIVTTKDDAASIHDSPSYKKLSQTIDVTTSLYDGDLSIPHDAMSACYRIGIDAASARGAAIVFLTPDLIWSDGSFIELERLASQGHRVVHTLGLRLLKETFVPAVARVHRSADNATLTIAPRDLVQFALHHLHPIAKTHMWEETGDSMVPANLYWRVNGEGLLARCFHLHPLLVNPSRKNVHFHGTVDDDFVMAACPDSASDYVVTDSDQLLACEISRKTHAVQTNCTQGVVSDIAAWAEGAANKRHRKLALIPIRFHATAISEDKWDAVERRATAVMNEALSLLDRHWANLLITRPKVLLKRIVRVAQDTVTQFKNDPDQYKFWPWAGAKTALVIYRSYVELCRKYTVWRVLLNDRLFGTAAHPYLWHPLWLAHRALCQALPLRLPETDAPLLFVTDENNPLRAALEAMVRASWQGDVVTATTQTDLSALHGPYAAVVYLSDVLLPDQQNILKGYPPQQSFALGTPSALYKLFTWRPSPVLIEMVLLVPILVCTALMSAVTNGLDHLVRTTVPKNTSPTIHISAGPAADTPAQE